MDGTPRSRTIFVYEHVTGGGLQGAAPPASWAAEGSAMRRAVSEDFAAIPNTRVLMALDNRFPTEPGPWTTVRVGPSDDHNLFDRSVAEADYTLIIAPETGGVLADLTHVIEARCSRSLGSSATAIDLVTRKDRLAHHWREAGVSTPDHTVVTPGSGLPRDGRYPAVLKPDDGAGTIATYYIESRDACPTEAVAALPNPALLQEFIPGAALSASYLIDSRGRAWLVGVGAQRMKVVSRKFSYLGGAVTVGTSQWADEASRSLGVVPGLRGWVGVDFIWDERAGRATVLEINPRLTTSYIGLRALLPQGELARAWLAAIENPDSLAEFDLAGRTHALPPVQFDADGTVRRERLVP